MIKLYRYAISELSDAAYTALAEKHAKELGGRLARMRDENDRKRTLAGRMLLERAAVELCGAHDPTILRTEAGKPYFAELPIRFSLSHSGDRVILAVSDREIGADIERILPRSLAAAKRFFTKEEQAYLQEAEDACARFYEIWTKKEAYGKWLGGGMADALSADTTALSFYTENDGEYALAVYEE